MAASASTDGPLAPKQAPLVTLKLTGPPPEPLPPRDWMGAETTAPPAAAPAKKGLWSGIKSAVGQKIDGAASTVRKAAQGVIDNRDVQTYHAKFPAHIHAGSRLRSVFSCVAMHEGIATRGTLYVSTTHISFDAPEHHLRDEVSLDNVDAWLPSVALPTTVPRMLYFVPVPSDAVVPNAFQLFTRKGQVFQFAQLAQAIPTAAGDAVVVRQVMADVEAVWTARNVRAPEYAATSVAAASA